LLYSHLRPFFLHTSCISISFYIFLSSIFVHLYSSGFSLIFFLCFSFIIFSSFYITVRLNIYHVMTGTLTRLYRQQSPQLNLALRLLPHVVSVY
jgi:hypothetical protein